ncbi:glycoside hydrolase family 71/99-like protein [Galbibacter pacificus]|uniref:Glycoside hydrolase family 71/99-like protein n=1 Tax=Galbibacter pacificus TaxID=2996052 RepID=A0ABT6FMP4_9FLAO|nr:glycoside hydrolase family 71/99-like protein [Galbibacter pacificus]MDG3581056.1 glycoside hydrolase family 71/99-like protein [Galbibacter pacificus]MDG3584534.1 glycoside hydrolase family 71/99-like protein [Galbibacter pacificus]
MKYFNIKWTLYVCILPLLALSQEHNSRRNYYKKYELSQGLVMAGYQGWFNTPNDGANRGWHHYERLGKFEPGYCTIDLWPDVREYKETYSTNFKFQDGSEAKVFSSYDAGTVDLHFQWMQTYGIDGVFMQRFISEIRNPSGAKHFTTVLKNATQAATKYERAIAVMYDLSGSSSKEMNIVIKDWKRLLKTFKYNKRDTYPNYLFYKERPLVAIWGVGFNDGREYTLEDIKMLISFFKSDEGGNCTVLLGVPTYWREQGRDCIKDQDFLDVIKSADVIHPWFVGRFREETYDSFKDLIGKDQKWCESHGLRYMPVVFPGFSWNNMLSEGHKSSTIPRNGGNFLWKQISGASSQGASMLYVAMFDEIDEGTAIFKISREVPIGTSKFIPVAENLPSDFYLKLVGKASSMLKNQVPIPDVLPIK